MLTAHSILFKTWLCLPGALCFSLLPSPFYLPLLSLRAPPPQAYREEAPFFKKVSPKPAV